MLAQIVIAVLTWLHILSAMAWLGSILFLVVVLNPVMSNLSPKARNSLAIKIFPKTAIFIRAFGGIAIIFGIALMFSLSSYSLADFSPTTNYGKTLMIGGVLAIVAYIGLGEGMLMPSFSKFLKIASQYSSKDKEGQPAQLGMLERRISVSSILQLIVLLAVLGAMVTAGVV